MLSGAGALRVRIPSPALSAQSVPDSTDPDMEHLDELISTALQTAAHELPLAGMAVVWFALIIGLIVWFRGRKMAKLAFAGFGAAVLGFVGFLAADALGAGSAAWFGGVIGLLLGALIGAILLRFTVAVAVALVLALVSPMIAATAIQRFGSPPGLSEKAHDALDEGVLFLEGVPIVDSLPDAADNAIDAFGPTKPSDDLADGVDRAKAFLARLGEELRPVWEQVPERDRLLLGLSSLIGAGIGFAFGMIFSKKATMVVTAGLGAAMWLPAGIVLWTHYPALPDITIPTSSGLWAGVWAGVTVVGVILQSRGKKSSADKERDPKAPPEG